MFKALILSSLLCALVVSQSEADKVKSDLLAAGISSGAADGIVNIMSKFAPTQLPEGVTKSPQDMFFDFFKMMSEIDTYIKTQSVEDQTALGALLESKKKEFEAHFAKQK